MTIQFERGSPDRPRGHALLYVRSAADPAAVLATYLVVLPVAVDIARYIPPMLAASLPTRQTGEVSAVAWPPVPEPAESLEYLERLADSRDDDLLCAGSADPSRVERLFELVGQATQEYAELYSRRPSASAPPAAPAELDVDEVLYGLMGEPQRLTELVKLTGKLRDAVEAGRRSEVEASLADVRKLARHFPEKYRLEEYLAVAAQPGERARRLTELYVERCYRIVNEDYTGLIDVEERIKALA